ncbi:histone-lysine N-methyltransferase SETMAR [Trichonephila clavipes]|nr:histone-lysine N-methyltransferase SETMAR [Trichonephila clavipes]
MIPKKTVCKRVHEHLLFVRRLSVRRLTEELGYSGLWITSTGHQTNGLHAEIVEVEIEVVLPSIVPSGNFAELNRTVTSMVLKANDRRTSCPCHDEFRGPRSVSDRENASQAHKKLCAVYGEEALKERQCQNWFAKFRSGDFSLKDEKLSDRPVEVDDDLIKAIIDSDHHSTTREIAEKLHVSHTSIKNHLKQLGYVQKLDIWVPHELKETHLTQRINSCDLLKKRNENYTFLKRLITGDEKWVVYNSIKRKKSWSRPGEPTQTTSKEVEEKRPELTNQKGVVFHHDNARPHTSLVTRQKLLELGWDVLPHPPYSPDLAPSDYFLFRSLQNSLNGKNFNNGDDVKSYLI